MKEYIDIPGVMSYSKIGILESSEKISIEIFDDLKKITGNNVYLNHEIRKRSSYHSSRLGKYFIEIIDQTIVNVSNKLNLNSWKIKAYLESNYCKNDLDTIAGICFDLDKSDDGFVLKNGINYYQELFSIFKDSVPKFLKSKTQKELIALRDYLK